MLNVQADLRARLAEALAPVQVAVAVPPDPPAELVTVVRDGGARENALIDRAGVAVRAWAPTEARACEIAEAAADAMASLPFEGGYAWSRMEEMRSAYDTNRGMPRWYASYTVAVFDPQGFTGGRK